VVEIADGSAETMPAKINSEMPLPMPRSVTCSPSHMRNAVPELSVTTHSRRNPQPGFNTTDAPVGDWICSRPMLMKRLWTIDSTTVP